MEADVKQLTEEVTLKRQVAIQAKKPKVEPEEEVPTDRNLLVPPVTHREEDDVKDKGFFLPEILKRQNNFPPLIVQEIFEGGETTVDELPEAEIKAAAEAKLRLEIEDLIDPSPAYKTLFRGLKLGHPENVALVQPLLYMARRVFFAIAIVFMQNSGVTAVCLLLGLSTLSLCGLATLKPWKD